MAEEGSLFAGACFQWVSELEAFTDTGMASAEFLAHLDACPACQTVAARVFYAEAAAYDALMSEENGIAFAGACPQWIPKLETFIRTGMVSAEFRAHLDACPACQTVVAKIFDAEAAAFEALLRELRGAGRLAVAERPKLSWYRRLLNRLFGR